MDNPYLQVALTYLRRPLARDLRWNILSIFVVLLAFSIFPDGHGVGVLLAAALFPLLAFVNHIIEPFASWNAHLTPRIRRVHAVVAVIMASLVLVILPAAVAHFLGGSPLTVVAFVILCFGAVLWAVTLDASGDSNPWTRVVFSCLGALALLCMFIPSAREMFAPFFAGQFNAAAIFGLLMVWCGTRQIARMDGDTTRNNALPLSQYWASKQPDVAVRQRMQNALGSSARKPNGSRHDDCMARWINHARRASASSWSDIYRWRVGMPEGWRSWLFGVIVVFAIEHLAAWAVPINTHSLWLWLNVFFWLIAIPPIAVAMQLAFLGCHIEYAMLLPVDRKTLSLQFALAIAISQFRQWSGMYVAFLLWWLTTWSMPFSFSLFLFFSVGSLLTQIGLFGIMLALAWDGLRKAPERPLDAGAATGPLFLFAMLVWVTIIFPHSWLCIVPSLAWAIPALASFAFGSLALAWFTYRRWLATDLA